jgi:hypothetical protein
MTDDVFERMLAKAPRPEQAQETTCAVCGHTCKPFYAKCPRCEGRRNREHVERLAELIRELKAKRPRGAKDEAAAIQRLRDYQHPCPEDFLKAISGEANTKSTRGDW